MFDKILIANRGEIACRIMGTARRLGIESVAVFSNADAAALHVMTADEAVLIGPPPARDSYLNAAAIIDAARRTGAEAIHPGYGFLSENAEFAEACAAADITFIGPPPAAIRAMGLKSAAKKIMIDAGVPVVPGYHGENQDIKHLQIEARKIGYPILIKASAGGGGRGMRIVEREVDLGPAVDSARREAMNAFGNDRVLIEKYLVRPRHIEVQVFADNDGNAVHLFERDCSIQRRHQKVIEEAPAPGIDARRRAKMGKVAVAAARAIDYVGAGTVEFIVDSAGDFYFMEMNTRLQVEHAATEMITGQDLVEWQLIVAFGGALPCGQDDLSINGHAFEARIYAEDPARDFLPQTGHLDHVGFPAAGNGVRVDTGIRHGDDVTIHYDAMLAKLIVWDSDRARALRGLQRALAETAVVGVTTNVAFLAAIAKHPAFVAGEFNTGFTDEYRAELISAPDATPEGVLALASLYLLLTRAEAAARAAAVSDDPYSPWHRTDGWRLNEDNHHVIHYRDGEREVSVTVHYRDHGYAMDLPAGQVQVHGRIEEDGALYADIDGLRLRATIVHRGDRLIVMTGRAQHVLVIHDPLAEIGEEEAVGGGLAAPMPGKVIQVIAKAGRKVAKGAPLIILEAMKMEHTIAAPADGTVEAVHYRVGDQVEEGVELIAFAADEPA